MSNALNVYVCNFKRCWLVTRTEVSWVAGKPISLQQHCLSKMLELSLVWVTLGVATGQSAGRKSLRRSSSPRSGTLLHCFASCYLFDCLVSSQRCIYLLCELFLAFLDESSR